jgi:hypothetical protein
MTDVTVQYDRKLSDGNYGSEGLSMSWTVTYDDSDNDLAANRISRGSSVLNAEPNDVSVWSVRFDGEDGAEL